MKFLTILPGYYAQEVLAKLANVTMAPTAIEHIILTVIIAEYKLVYRLCPVYNLIDKGLSQSINIGSLGLIRYSHTNTANFAFVHIVSAKEKVELIIGLYDSRGPQCHVQPGDVLLLQNVLVLGPVHQIRTAESIKVQLLFIRRTVRWEYPIFTRKNSSFGVCVPTLSNRIATGLLLFCTDVTACNTGNSQYDD